MRLLFMTDFSEQFPYRLLRGVMRYSRESGERWAVCRMPPSFLRANGLPAVVRYAVEWKADVVIGAFEPEDNLELFRREGIVVLALDNVSLFPDVPNITADYHRMGLLAARRFEARGFREFGFVGIRGLCWSDGRLEGFREYLEKAGYAGHIHFYTREHWDSQWSYRPERLQAWLRALPKPVGLMACDDTRASFVVETCHSLGLRIPEEVAIIGVDNDEIQCEMSIPSISSIDVDLERGGYELAEMVSEMVRDPSNKGHDILLRPLDIVTRESSNIITTKDQLVHQALTIIHSNLDRKISVPDILKEVPISRRGLEERFYKATGTSIYRYIIYQRVNHFAGLLLSSKESIANLAARMDEADPKSLSRRFKELKGCTPSAYRKKNLRKL
jgi:LacI family transcriptional regulator